MQDFESGKDDFNGKMRLYRFWKTMPFDVIIDGRSERINCTAGSNISLADAAGRCAAQAEKIQKIIAGRESVTGTMSAPFVRKLFVKLTQTILLRAIIMAHLF